MNSLAAVTETPPPPAGGRIRRLRLLLVLPLAGTATCDWLTSLGNDPPAAVGAIPDQIVEVDGAVVLDASRYFDDPDGDSLAYAVVSGVPGTAAAAVSGATVTVTGVAKGRSGVTVTARDPDGLEAEQSFMVTVPNRGPVAVAALADAEVHVDDELAIDVAAYFSDPDGDDLEYAAESADAALVRVAVSGSAVTVTGVAVGGAPVTVTARDTEGLAVSQSFAVTVPNRAPAAVGRIEDLEVEVDSVAALDVAPFFADPDRQPLAYAVVSADPSRATAALAGAALTLTGVAKGETGVTVTATDPGGLGAEQSFTVTVPNRGPVVVAALADAEVHVGDELAIDVAAHFSDPDGDALEYSAVSSDAALARVAVSGGAVTVTGVAVGAASVTVTARDTEGLAVDQSFAVTVPNRPPVAVGGVADMELEVDAVGELDVAQLFADPDRQPLTYGVVAADPGRVAAVLAGAALTLTGVAKGETLVTVTATDPGDLEAEQRFTVTVPNRAPVAVASLADAELHVDDELAIDAAAHFSDPDGDDLEYSAVSSDAARVGVAASGGTVTVAAVAPGAALVTVTARDTEGLTVEQSFAVTVPNRPPAPVGSVADLELEAGAVATLDVAPFFADPDREPLAYAVVSSDPSRATAGGSGSAVTLTGVAGGRTTVTVTATDPGGLEAEQRFTVTVPNRSPWAVGTIADRTVTASGEATVDAAPYFSDPDGDELAYAAASSDTDVVTVVVSGSVVTATGVAAGDATVTVTATDGEGASASQSFGFAVEGRPNRRPRPAGNIPTKTVREGAATTIDADGYFTDPDGDDLAYAATSSDTAVATVAVAGSEVTVTGVGAGEATVTLTATDAGGLSAVQRFGVTVQEDGGGNRPPQPVGAIADHTVTEGGSAAIDATPYFSDPDGDDLTYAATSSDTAVAAVVVSGSEVTVTGSAEGDATVTVTATDGGGLSAVQSFGVTVQEGGGGNRPPFVTSRIADLSGGRPGQTHYALLRRSFSDPDGDELAWSASSGDEDVAAVRFGGDTLFIDLIGVGATTVAVTARDPGGLSASLDFRVEVVADGFEIRMGFTSAVSETHRVAIRRAGTSWESILAPTDLPDVQASRTYTCLGLQASGLGTIDDHLIMVHVDSIDGEGSILGYARYCYVRTADGTPVISATVLDEADIDRLHSNSRLWGLAFHEIGHGLGFGSTYWTFKDVLDASSDPHFTGSLALAAFNAAGGTSYTGAKVPVGPNHSHWRESVLRREIMTSHLNGSSYEPVSAVTIQAMADLGYSVDVSQADSFLLAHAAPPDAAEGPTYDLTGDVVPGPIVVIDADGRTVRVLPPPPGAAQRTFPVTEVSIPQGPVANQGWTLLPRRRPPPPG